MLSENIINWFLPSGVRRNRSHPEFHQMYSLVSACIVGAVAMSSIPLLLLHFGYDSLLWTYYLNVGTTLVTLFFLRYTGYWRLPNYISAAIAYFIVFTWLRDSGLIYSGYMGMLHIYLICALLADHKFGWLVLLTNLMFLGYLYHLTIAGPVEDQLSAELGSPLYVLLMHMVITVFMGGFLAYGLREQELNRRRIKALQDEQIDLLDEAVRKRTDQLSRMRQTIATDFHDHTGNMLAAINRQAAMLELEFSGNMEAMVFVRSIIDNSNGLYASSKDFLWTLNHDSDSPATLFQYLTGYGQRFYNQFDISFSVESKGDQRESGQLDPFAALNLIYIFKEAMTNVIKHTAADEVLMTMEFSGDAVHYVLSDNGQWKQASDDKIHYGLNNMKRRAAQSGFEFLLTHDQEGTRIAVSVQLGRYLIEKRE